MDGRWGGVGISERLKPLGLGWPNGRFPWWATDAIIAREVAVTALRWRVAKAKTAAQLLAVGMAMAPLSPSFHTATWAVAFAAVALTLYSGAEYFLTSTHQVKVD
jgi:CDP-diacylglycerol--glycerol-3-phosphate 3-phosphatidyltransferase